MSTMTSINDLVSYLTSPAVIGECWTSFRVWSPAATIAGLLSLVAPRRRETYASLSGDAGDRLHVAVASPDPAGFHRAVGKLVTHPDALKNITKEIERLIEVKSRRSRSPDLRWYGRQLVAIDSSDLVLGTSRELIDLYGGPGNSKGICQIAHARLIVAWDVRRKVILGWHLAPYRSNERALLTHVIASLEKGTVVLLDRGFPSLDVITILREHDLRFIVRVTGGKSSWRCYRHLLKRGSGIREAGVNVPGDVAPLRVVVRPWRNRGPRNGAKPEPTILLTDLDQRYFFAGAILAAYERRWTVETFFRELKVSITSVERWHSRSSARILLEIQAIFIWFLLAALVEISRLQYANNAAKDRLSGKFVERVRLMLSTVKLLFSLFATGTCDLRAEFTLLGRYLVKPRHDRHFKRQCRSPLGRSY